MWLFDTSDFPARWDCGNWTAAHGWTHIISDLAIFGAYVAIPLSIVYFLRRRPDILFPRVGWLFVAFIFACGTVHLIESAIFWHPIYRFSALVKVLTAAVSIATVVALIRLAPQLLAIPDFMAMTARLERELKEKEVLEDKFRKFVEYAPNAVLAVDADGMIHVANRQAVDLFGYSVEQLMEMNVDRLVPDEVRGRHADLRDGYFSSPEPRQMGKGELLARRADGSTVPVEIGLTPIETALGRRVLCAIADVSERVEARRRLERDAAALERSNADLERFAYVASHDLQEPLRMVSSYLQLLERRLQGQLDAEATEFIGFAVDGAKRMQQLINDLLAFSRVGYEQITPEKVSVASVVAAAQRNLAAVIEENEVVVELSESFTVMAHASQLELLFQNVIGNAIKYRSEASPLIQVKCLQNGEFNHFAIRDNGIGVASTYLERIFEVFARLHGREIPGTGIGLAICKRIVERHGGRIWAESEPGVGTTIHFTLHRTGRTA